MSSSGRSRTAWWPARIAAPFREVFETATREDASLRRFAAHYVRLVVERCGHNKREACRVLGIGYHTLEGHLRRAARGRDTVPPVP